MSRYVSVALTIRDRTELLAALNSLGLQIESANELIMLDGSLECAGEPVEIRARPGQAGAAEDFGFVRDEAGAYRLVCSELDRRRLEGELLTPLRATIAVARVEPESLIEIDVEADGSRRIVVRRKREP